MLPLRRSIIDITSTTNNCYSQSCKALLLELMMSRIPPITGKRKWILIPTIVNMVKLPQKVMDILLTSKLKPII